MCKFKKHLREANDLILVGELFAEIIVFSSLEKTLHYLIPRELRNRAKPGMRVIVPLGRRESLGLILKIGESLPQALERITVRPVLSIIDQAPIVPNDLLRICQWISTYYFYPLGEVLRSALPSGIQSRAAVYYRLTDAGKKAIQSNEKPQLAPLFSQQDWMNLTEKPDVELPGNIRRKLAGFEREGLVERRVEWQPPQIRAKKIKAIRLIGSPDAEPISDNANLKAFLDILQCGEGFPVPARDLRRAIKNFDYWLRKLQEKGLVAVEEIEEIRQSDLAQDLPPSRELDLSQEQGLVLEEIIPHIKKHSFQPFLIHGVTGSGKTEIYIRLIDEALKLNRGALVLVPEIALSTQIEALFRQRFASRLAVWHSSLAIGARYDQWREVLCGKRDIVLGVRSAVFMPIANLGLIIVDEEHDSSYKQEDRLRYHARDVSLMRARMLGIPIVLGSATPSLQSFHHSVGKRYKRLFLSKRILDRPLPELEIVDMRRESNRSRILSMSLQKALVETVQRGEQALIFLNRRGFATFLLCHLCGYVLQCSDCSVSLTYHHHEDNLHCHYCGLTRSVPQYCPACSNAGLILHGFGTERVEQEIKKLLPAAATVRIDRDTVKRPEDLVKCFNSFRNRQADILVGTQMIAKGHDFPNITLVGIVNADTALQITDFRAGETTVQLLMQVAGRTGRGELPGRVILQTYNPAHYTIQSVIKMDYELFCTKELTSRKELQYPPFSRLTKLLVTGPKEEMTQNAAQHLASLCRTIAAEFRQLERPIAILGPSPAPLLKLKRRYRWQLFAKAWTNADMQEFTAAILEQAKSSMHLRRIQVSVDRDPMTTL